MMADDIFVISSDSDEDNTCDENPKIVPLKVAAENIHFRLLSEKFTQILFYYLNNNISRFPYEELRILSMDIRQTFLEISNESVKSFIWDNIIQWLFAMKLSYREAGDLKYDNELNSILTNFMEDFINFKCSQYCKSSNPEEVHKIIDEILHTITIFSGNSEYIIMTLIKVQISEKHSKILEPIFRKYLSDKNYHDYLSDKNYHAINKLISYIRLVLCYKLWQRLVSNKEQKTEIIQLAIGARTDDGKINTKNGGILPKYVPLEEETNEIFKQIMKMDIDSSRELLLLTSKYVHERPETIRRHLKFFERYTNPLNSNDNSSRKPSRFAPVIEIPSSDDDDNNNDKVLRLSNNKTLEQNKDIELPPATLPNLSVRDLDKNVQSLIYNKSNQNIINIPNCAQDTALTVNKNITADIGSIASTSAGQNSQLENRNDIIVNNQNEVMHSISNLNIDSPNIPCLPQSNQNSSDVVSDNKDIDSNGQASSCTTELTTEHTTETTEQNICNTSQQIITSSALQSYSDQAINRELVLLPKLNNEKQTGESISQNDQEASQSSQDKNNVLNVNESPVVEENDKLVNSQIQATSNNKEEEEKLESSVVMFQVQHSEALTDKTNDSLNRLEKNDASLNEDQKQTADSIEPSEKAEITCSNNVQAMTDVENLISEETSFLNNDHQQLNNTISDINEKNKSEFNALAQIEELARFPIEEKNDSLITGEKYATENISHVKHSSHPLLQMHEDISNEMTDSFINDGKSEILYNIGSNSKANQIVSESIDELFNKIEYGFVATLEKNKNDVPNSVHDIVSQQNQVFGNVDSFKNIEDNAMTVDEIQLKSHEIYDMSLKTLTHEEIEAEIAEQCKTDVTSLSMDSDLQAQDLSEPIQSRAQTSEEDSINKNTNSSPELIISNTVDILENFDEPQLIITNQLENIVIHDNYNEDSLLDNKNDDEGDSGNLGLNEDPLEIINDKLETGISSEQIIYSESFPIDEVEVPMNMEKLDTGSLTILEPNKIDFTNSVNQHVTEELNNFPKENEVDVSNFNNEQNLDITDVSEINNCQIYPESKNEEVIEEFVVYNFSESMASDLHIQGFPENLKSVSQNYQHNNNNNNTNSANAELISNTALNILQSFDETELMLTNNLDESDLINHSYKENNLMLNNENRSRDEIEKHDLNSLKTIKEAIDNFQFIEDNISDEINTNLEFIKKIDEKPFSILHTKELNEISEIQEKIKLDLIEAENIRKDELGRFEAKIRCETNKDNNDENILKDKYLDKKEVTKQLSSKENIEINEQTLEASNLLQNSKKRRTIFTKSDFNAEHSSKPKCVVKPMEHVTEATALPTYENKNKNIDLLNLSSSTTINLNLHQDLSIFPDEFAAHNAENILTERSNQNPKDVAENRIHSTCKNIIHDFLESDQKPIPFQQSKVIYSTAPQNLDKHSGSLKEINVDEINNLPTTTNKSIRLAFLKERKLDEISQRFREEYRTKFISNDIITPQRDSYNMNQSNETVLDKTVKLAGISSSESRNSQNSSRNISLVSANNSAPSIEATKRPVELPFVIEKNISNPRSNHTFNDYNEQPKIDPKILDCRAMSNLNLNDLDGNASDQSMLSEIVNRSVSKSNLNMNVIPNKIFTMNMEQICKIEFNDNYIKTDNLKIENEESNYNLNKPTKYVEATEHSRVNENEESKYNLNKPTKYVEATEHIRKNENEESTYNLIKPTKYVEATEHSRINENDETKYNLNTASKYFEHTEHSGKIENEGTKYNLNATSNYFEPTEHSRKNENEGIKYNLNTASKYFEPIEHNKKIENEESKYNLNTASKYFDPTEHSRRKENEDSKYNLNTASKYFDPTEHSRRNENEGAKYNLNATSKYFEPIEHSGNNENEGTKYNLITTSKYFEPTDHSRKHENEESKYNLNATSKYFEPTEHSRKNENEESKYNLNATSKYFEPTEHTRKNENEGTKYNLNTSKYIEPTEHSRKNENEESKYNLNAASKYFEPTEHTRKNENEGTNYNLSTTSKYFDPTEHSRRKENEGTKYNLNATSKYFEPTEHTRKNENEGTNYNLSTTSKYFEPTEHTRKNEKVATKYNLNTSKYFDPTEHSRKNENEGIKYNLNTASKYFEPTEHSRKNDNEEAKYGLNRSTKYIEATDHSRKNENEESKYNLNKSTKYFDPTEYSKKNQNEGTKYNLNTTSKYVDPTEHSRKNQNEEAKYGLNKSTKYIEASDHSRKNENEESKYNVNRSAKYFEATEHSRKNENHETKYSKSARYIEGSGHSKKNENEETKYSSSKSSKYIEGSGHSKKHENDETKYSSNKSAKYIESSGHSKKNENEETKYNLNKSKYIETTENSRKNENDETKYSSSKSSKHIEASGHNKKNEYNKGQAISSKRSDLDKNHHSTKSNHHSSRHTKRERDKKKTQPKPVEIDAFDKVANDTSYHTKHNMTEVGNAKKKPKLVSSHKKDKSNNERASIGTEPPVQKSILPKENEIISIKFHLKINPTPPSEVKKEAVATNAKNNYEVKTETLPAIENDLIYNKQDEVKYDVKDEVANKNSVPEANSINKNLDEIPNTSLCQNKKKIAVVSPEESITSSVTEEQNVVSANYSSVKSEPDRVAEGTTIPTTNGFNGEIKTKKIKLEQPHLSWEILSNIYNKPETDDEEEEVSTDKSFSTGTRRKGRPKKNKKSPVSSNSCSTNKFDDTSTETKRKKGRPKKDKKSSVTSNSCASTNTTLPTIDPGLEEMITNSNSEQVSSSTSDILFKDDLEKKDYCERMSLHLVDKKGLKFRYKTGGGPLNGEEPMEDSNACQNVSSTTNEPIADEMKKAFSLKQLGIHNETEQLPLSDDQQQQLSPDVPPKENNCDNLCLLAEAAQNTNEKIASPKEQKLCSNISNAVKEKSESKTYTENVSTKETKNVKSKKRKRLSSNEDKQPPCKYLATDNKALSNDKDKYMTYKSQIKKDDSTKIIINKTPILDVQPEASKSNEQEYDDKIQEGSKKRKKSSKSKKHRNQNIQSCEVILENCSLNELGDPNASYKNYKNRNKHKSKSHSSKHHKSHKNKEVAKKVIEEDLKENSDSETANSQIDDIPSTISGIEMEIKNINNFNIRSSDNDHSAEYPDCHNYNGDYTLPGVDMPNFMENNSQSRSNKPIIVPSNSDDLINSINSSQNWVFSQVMDNDPQSRSNKSLIVCSNSDDFINPISSSQNCLYPEIVGFDFEPHIQDSDNQSCNLDFLNCNSSYIFDTKFPDNLKYNNNINNSINNNNINNNINNCNINNSNINNSNINNNINNNNNNINNIIMNSNNYNNNNINSGLIINNATKKIPEIKTVKEKDLNISKNIENSNNEKSQNNTPNYTDRDNRIPDYSFNGHQLNNDKTNSPKTVKNVNFINSNKRHHHQLHGSSTETNNGERKLQKHFKHSIDKPHVKVKALNAPTVSPRLGQPWEFKECSPAQIIEELRRDKQFKFQ